MWKHVVSSSKRPSTTIVSSNKQPYWTKNTKENIVQTNHTKHQHESEQDRTEQRGLGYGQKQYSRLTRSIPKELPQKFVRHIHKQDCNNQAVGCEQTWNAIVARGDAMPLKSAMGPSVETMCLMSPVAEVGVTADARRGCCSRILTVSKGCPAITPAIPPKPPARNSLPEVLPRNSGQNSIGTKTLVSGNGYNSSVADIL